MWLDGLKELSPPRPVVELRSIFLHLHFYMGDVAHIHSQPDMSDGWSIKVVSVYPFEGFTYYNLARGLNYLLTSADEMECIYVMHGSLLVKVRCSMCRGFPLGRQSPAWQSEPGMGIR